MLRYVLLLLLANAVFAPATALTVDHVEAGANADFATYWTLDLAAGDGAATSVNAGLVAPAPLPPSIWLFVAALATGLALIRRRQHAAG